MDSVAVLGTDPACLFQDVVLGAHDKKMLQMIDNETTMQELIDRSTAGSFEAMKTIYVLYSLGIIEVKDRAPEKAEGVPLEDILKPCPKEKEALMRRVEELHAKLHGLSARELLEVDEGADPESIKKNYYGLMKEFHPDRFLILTDPSIKDKVTAIIEAIESAYSLLKDGGDGTEALPAGSPEAGLSEGLPAAAEDASPPVEAPEEAAAEEAREEEAPGSGVNEADLCISRGEYEAAMDIYSHLLSKSPHDAYILQRIEELKTLLRLLGKKTPSISA
jgi:hypothetical protein